MPENLIDDTNVSAVDIRVHVHYLHQGQLRPYADSEWRAEIRVEQFMGGGWQTSPVG